LSSVLGFLYYSCLQSKGKRLGSQAIRKLFLVIFCDSFRAEKAEGILALHDDKGGMALEPINASLKHSYNLASHVERLGLLKELSVFDDGVLFVCFNHTNNIQEKAARVKFFVKFFQKTFTPPTGPPPPFMDSKKRELCSTAGGVVFFNIKFDFYHFQITLGYVGGKQRGAPYVLYN